MSETYVLPEPDFTPAPGWENIMSATPQMAHEGALRVQELATKAFVTECQGRHMLLSLKEQIESDAIIREILSLHSSVASFLHLGNWDTDTMRMLRSSLLSEDLKAQVAPPLRTINAVHRPLPFGDAARAWAEHAIQPVGTDRVSYRDALADWLVQTEDFRREPEFPRGFLGVSLNFAPPAMPDTMPPREDYGYVWEDVCYDPALGYRAALHVIRQAHAGRLWRRNHQAERTALAGA